MATQLSVSAYFGDIPVDEAFAMIEQAHRLEGDSPSGRSVDRSGSPSGSSAWLAGSRRPTTRCGARTRCTRSWVRRWPSSPRTRRPAETLRLEGRLEEAEELLREMSEAYDAIGETGFNSTIVGLLANTLCDQGRYEEAERFVARSRELSADDDFASQASWRMAQARVLADRGEFEDAIRLADEAVEINGQTDYIGWQGDGLEVKGQVLEAAGRGDDARAAYEEAIARYERKGNVVAAGRVRARLEHIGGA